MDLNIHLLDLAQDLASHAAKRQSLIAENVANADTPKYKAKDIVDFSETYAGRDRSGLTLKTTRESHIAPGQVAGPPRVFETEVMGAESPNGNSVSLEDQMLRSAAVRQSHDLALGIYSKSLDLMRAALGRGR